MIFLQITSDTEIAMTIVQFASLVGVLFIIAKGYFQLLSKTKDLTMDISNVKMDISIDFAKFEKEIKELKTDFEKKITELHQNINERTEEKISILDSKISRIEENSKTFYKQSEVKNAELSVKIDKLMELIIEIKLNIAENKNK